MSSSTESLISHVPLDGLGWSIYTQRHHFLLLG